MAYKSLILGVVFSMGVFAVKSGVGLHYFLSKTASGERKNIVLALFFVFYLALFLISQKALGAIDVVRHMGTIQALIRSGMIIHLAMAGLLMLWGLHLLRHEAKKNFRTPSKKDFRASGGWLMLVVPCPVCLTVVVLSLGFLTVCFPDSAMTATLLLFLGFMLINVATIFVMGGGVKKSGATPEVILGSAMLLISVYFLLSVTVMPRFADADKIYRISLASTDSARPVPHAILFYAFMTMAFAGGFAHTFLSSRRKS